MIMKMLRKEYNLKIIMIGAFILFFGYSIAYCSNRHLRLPLGESINEKKERTSILLADIVHKRYSRHLDGAVPAPLKHLKNSLKWPVIGYIWSFHESRYKSGSDEEITLHKGIDIIAKPQTLVRAIFAGKVINVNYDFVNGCNVYVRSDNGLVCVYSHLAYADKKYSFPVNIGTRLKAEEIIGKASVFPAFYSYIKQLDDITVAPDFDREQPASHLHLQAFYVSPEIEDKRVSEKMEYAIQYSSDDIALEKNILFEINPLLLLELLSPRADKDNIMYTRTKLFSLNVLNTSLEASIINRNKI